MVTKYFLSSFVMLINVELIYVELSNVDISNFFVQ
jgi:hypothetical protein